MKSLFNYLIGFLLGGLIIFSIVSLNLQGMQIDNIENMHLQFVNRIEASYYNEDVIRECQQKADEYGFQLTVEDRTIYDDRKDVAVISHYSVTDFLYGKTIQGEYVSYAR